MLGYIVRRGASLFRDTWHLRKRYFLKLFPRVTEIQNLLPLWRVSLSTSCFGELDGSQDLFCQESWPVFPWMQAQFDFFDAGADSHMALEMQSSHFVHRWHVSERNLRFFQSRAQEDSGRHFAVEPSTREVVLLSDGSSLANSPQGQSVRSNAR